MTRSLEIARADCLDGVAHGFFGHSGRAHQFGYGGPGDPRDVARDRAAAAEAVIAGGLLAAPHQVHSPDCLAVEKAWDDVPEGRPIADALATSVPGVVLGVVTADCAPVLFADRHAGVVGAAHAGWRGAHGGVLENTIATMQRLGAEHTGIVAAIGPTIAQQSYEVDAGFRSQFAADDDRHFRPAPMRGGIERWLFDLPGYIAARLERAGIARIENLARDTLAEPESYYSYRRATLRGAPDYGRQISMIAAG